MTTRARKHSILVHSASLAGVPVDATNLANNTVPVFNNNTGKFEFLNFTLAGLGFTYPGAGIPLSTGSGWGTSITNNSANWNAAYGWGDHLGNYIGIGGLTTNTGKASYAGDVNDLRNTAAWVTGTSNRPLNVNSAVLSLIPVITGTYGFQLGGRNENLTYRGFENGVWGDWRTIRHTGNFVAGTHYQAPLTNPVTGTGTTNYLTKWSGIGSGIVNSQIFDNGTNVGVNNTSPTYRLDVRGVGRYTTSGTGIQPALYLKNSSNYAANRGVGLFLTASTDMELASLSSGWGANDTESYFSIQVRSGGALVERVRLLADGSLAIDNTAPTERLDVNGNARFRTIGTTAATTVLGTTSTGVLTTNTASLFEVTRLKASSTPADPESGNSVIWMSADGDIMVKINVGGTTVTRTLATY